MTMHIDGVMTGREFLLMLNLFYALLNSVFFCWLELYSHAQSLEQKQMSVWPA